MELRVIGTWVDGSVEGLPSSMARCSCWKQILGSLWSDQLFRTLVLINLASIMEKADEALLPGVYREIGIAMHASPTALGTLTLLRSSVQVICFPLAAYASLRHSRANVIALGALLWSIATFFVGASSTFVQVAISRALNGIGLALVIPAIQSLVADATEADNRGLAFGWVQFTGNVGGILGNVCSVLLAGTTVFGIAGWRASFYLITILSVVVGVLVYKYAIDPRFTENATQEKEIDGASTACSALKETFQGAKKVVKIPTFLVIVAQGVAGTFPWAAMSFAPMWLELIGFSHTVTAIIIGLFVASNSLGGLFGGKMGDIFSRHLPNSGRIILAQFSSGIGIPLGAVLLLLIPDDTSTAVLHGAVIFIMGFLISWCGTATNNPIFAEIVPEKSRTSVYALDRSFESLLASFAPPVVGILAERVFGYVASPSDEVALSANKKNAAALAKALYASFGAPYTVCCLVYSLLYWTYPKDRDKARAEAQVESEMAITGVVIQSLNGKPGYVSLKEETDCTRVRMDEDETFDDLKASGEEQRMLPETIEP